MKKISKKSVKLQYKNPANLDARRYLNEKFGTNKSKFSWYEWVFNHLYFSEKAKILELGCGLGNLWTNNSTRIPKNWDITLSDFSKQMLKKAKQNVKNVNHDFYFQVIDAEKIPYDNETFDVVIANAMLYLVPDVEKIIKEIARVIKPGGTLVASTSGSKYMKELEDLLLESKLPVHKNYTNYAFSLENGESFLSKYFSKIEMFHMQDSLLVTEAEPLANYVLSTNIDLTDKQKDEVYLFFEEYFQKSTDFFITKETGLFLARK